MTAEYDIEATVSVVAEDGNPADEVFAGLDYHFAELGTRLSATRTPRSISSSAMSSSPGGSGVELEGPPSAAGRGGRGRADGAGAGGGVGEAGGGTGRKVQRGDRRVHGGGGGD